MTSLSKRTLDTASDFIALLVLTIGVTTLLGWTLDFEPMKRVFSGFMPMSPLTAVALIAAAVSVWLATCRREMWRELSLALALLLVAVSLWQLVAMSLDLTVRPDRLFFPLAIDREIPPTRIAPETSVSLLLASVALASLQARRPALRSAGRLLGYSVGLIALFEFVAYIFGATTFYIAHHVQPMALHSTWGLFLLAVAVLLKCADHSVLNLVGSTGGAGRLLRRMLPASILVPTTLGGLALYGARAGYVSAPMALTMLATLCMVLFIGLTFAAARALAGQDLERQRRVEGLRQSEARLAAILAIAGDAIISVDADQRITLFNAWAEKTFGYTSAEVMGQSLSMLMPARYPALPDDVRTFEESHGAARRMGERQIYALRKNGEEFPAEATVSKLSLEGQALYTIVLRDVTERERAAAELLRAKEQAEAAAQSKSEFLANMSHELRTPINSISGFTQLLLQRTDLDCDVRDQVGKIKNAAAALISVVSDVLDYSRIEEGKTTLSLRAFSPPELIERCIHIMESIASVRHLRIEFSADRTLIGRYYLGDSNRIQQILLNLLSNAVKFTNEGSVSIKLETVPGESGEDLLFSVTDTGIGIPADRMDRLFERFSQVDGSMSRRYGGAGLGLAICKRLVGLMGGKIGVESEPGVGSRFWFSLPLSSAEAADTDVSPRASGQAGVHKRSILLVEDTELNREIVVAMLESLGHAVDSAADGEVAVRRAAEKAYDLILMDIQMPVMDGIAAAKAIRSSGGLNASTPIVAMTANVLPEQVARFYAAGMNCHVPKPIEFGELRDAVNRHATSNARAVTATAA